MAEARPAERSSAKPGPSGAAAAQRARRAVQARWLTALDGGAVASSTTLAAVGWDDLGQLPDWVMADAPSIARLVAHVGAWAHAAALRQCIDGRVLAAVRARIGDAPFAALMASSAEPAVNDATELHDVDSALIAMDARAQAVLLGAITQSALREAVRERVWPDAPPLLRPDAAADAQALVALARQHMEEPGASA